MTLTELLVPSGDNFGHLPIAPRHRFERSHNLSVNVPPHVESIVVNAVAALDGLSSRRKIDRCSRVFPHRGCSDTHDAAAHQKGRVASLAFDGGNSPESRPNA